MNAFLKRQTDGNIPSILHTYLIPARLKDDGITISCESNYPFVPCALRYTIISNKPFEFFIRIPSWATSSSTIKTLGPDSESRSDPFVSNASAGDGLESLYRVNVPSAMTYEIAITMNAEVRTEKHAGGSISIYYGPLLYAYEIDFETRTRLPRNYKDQASDCTEIAAVKDQDDEPWKSHTRDNDYIPRQDWGIAIDPSKDIKVVVGKGPWRDGDEKDVLDLPDPLWSSGSSPVHLEVSAVKVDWPIRNGTAADVVDVDTNARQGSPFVARLVPYATAKLHIAQFPTVQL